MEDNVGDVDEGRGPGAIKTPAGFCHIKHIIHQNGILFVPYVAMLNRFCLYGSVSTDLSVCMCIGISGADAEHLFPRRFFYDLFRIPHEIFEDIQNREAYR